MAKKFDLRKYIRDVPDYPKPGIIFKDITPLLQNPLARHYAIKAMEDAIKKNNLESNVVAGIEARGFIFASVLAQQMRLPLVPIRKEGKLPWKTLKEQYSMEYDTATLEIHQDAVVKGQNVLICDDLMATAGTALAAIKLVEKLGANIAGLLFLIELSYLKGRENLGNYNIISLIQYDE